MFPATPTPFLFYDSHIWQILVLKMNISEITFLTQTTLIKQMPLYFLMCLWNKHFTLLKANEMGVNKMVELWAAAPCAQKKMNNIVNKI